MPSYFVFKVVLQGITPPIWRQFLIRSTSNFDALHKAIQKSFGWENCHLHEFRATRESRDVIAGMPDPDGFDDRIIPDDKRIKLSSYFGTDMKVKNCVYIYDFGDNWIHNLELCMIAFDENKFSRRLISGERASPPEDCGGTSGYERMAHFVKTGEDLYDDPGVDLKRWLGDWKPDNFDLKKAKKEFDR